MNRELLFLLTFVGLPLVLYINWIRLVRRKSRHKRAWFWLMLLCMLGLAVLLVLYATQDGAPRSSLYRPAHLENGQLIPGQMEQP